MIKITTIVNVERNVTTSSPFKCCDREKQNNYTLIHHRNILLKLVGVKQQNRVVRTRYFFADSSLFGNWQMQCIHAKYVVPCSNHYYIVIKYNSYQTTNQQMKVMLFMLGVQQILPPKNIQAVSEEKYGK